MPNEEIELEPRRLKISEFMLGIFAGIIISILIESIITLWLTKQNAWIWLTISLSLLPLTFWWYKKIVGFPDFVEYSCKFSKNPDFEWKEFAYDFSNGINYNLNKNGFSFLGLFRNRLISRFTNRFKGYQRAEIRRTKLGTAKAYIYLYPNKQEFKFLIGIPNFSDKHQKILDVLKETMKDLGKKTIINKGWALSQSEYFHISFWYPMIIKGQKIESSTT